MMLHQAPKAAGVFVAVARAVGLRWTVVNRYPCH